jgi:hypothetical protein
MTIEDRLIIFALFNIPAVIIFFWVLFKKRVHIKKPRSEPKSSRVRHSHVMLVLLIAMSIIVQLLLAVRLPLLWFGPVVGAGDEQIYTLQALYLMYGKDFSGWTLNPFNRIRSFFYPAMLAGWFVLVKVFTGRDLPPFIISNTAPDYVGGVSQMGTWVFFNRLFNILISAVSIFFVYELSKTLFPDDNTALASSLLLGTNWVFLFWGARSSADLSAVPFLLVSVLFMVKSVDENNHTRLHSSLAGVFFGFGFMCRFQLIVIAPPILVLYLLKRRKLTCLWLGGLGLTLIFQSILDYSTWGTSSILSWFIYQYSAFVAGANGSPTLQQYTYFSVVLPPYYVIAILPYVFGAGIWLALLGMKRDWRSTVLASMSLIYIALIGVSGAKALRFLIPVIPLLCILGGNGCFIGGPKNRMWQYSLLCLSVAYGILMVTALLIYPTHVTDPLLS